MIVPNFEIYNRIDRPEYDALVASKEAPIQRNLAVATVDFSPGSSARALFLSTFPAGSKTQQNLKPYTDQFDTPLVPWPTATLAQGGGGLTSMVNTNDLKAAGIIP